MSLQEHPMEPAFGRQSLTTLKFTNIPNLLVVVSNHIISYNDFVRCLGIGGSQQTQNLSLIRTVQNKANMDSMSLPSASRGL